MSNEPLPAGLIYHPGFLTPGEGNALLAWIRQHDESAWQHPRMRGQDARRRMLCYGWQYLTQSRELSAALPIPPEILPYRSRCAGAAGVEEEALEQLIVTHYPRGAGIGPHSDAAVFGDHVLSLSLASSCRIVFKRNQERLTLTLAPSSLLVMYGPARSQWTHEILPVKAERFSLTFRSLAHNAPEEEN